MEQNLFYAIFKVAFYPSSEVTALRGKVSELTEEVNEQVFHFPSAVLCLMHIENTL